MPKYTVNGQYVDFPSKHCKNCYTLRSYMTIRTAWRTGGIAWAEYQCPECGAVKIHKFGSGGEEI